MNDTTKPAAKAVAIAHKAPSRATIDTAQDELANLNYKLGRAQVAAMLSSGQAKADRAAVEELTALVEEKRQAVETMVETFTNPTRSDPAVALDAIRSKLGQVDQANAPGAPGDPVAAAKPHDGGVIKPGVAYLVGEKTGEAIVGARTATPGDTLVGDDLAEGREKHVDIINVSHTITAEQAINRLAHLNRGYNVEDPESLNWGNDTGAPVGAFALVDKIENAKPGDVEIPDTSTPETIEALNHATHSGPKAPDHKPLLNDIWRDTSVSPPFDRTWNGSRWSPAFSPVSPHKATRPPLDPVQGATWTYPRSSGDVEMYFDTVEGWLLRLTPTESRRRAVAEDLSSDFWEKGELEHVLNAARPRKQLFGRG